MTLINHTASSGISFFFCTFSRAPAVMYRYFPSLLEPYFHMYFFVKDN